MNNLMLATNSGNLNLNIDQKTLDSCLKIINNIGSTIYQNICTGQSVSVPVGGADWIMGTLCIAIIGSFAILMLLFILSTIRGDVF